jgi:hypothetical protein
LRLPSQAAPHLERLRALGAVPGVTLALDVVLPCAIELLRSSFSRGELRPVPPLLAVLA